MNEINTVGDLLDQLANVDRDTPLRVATQPNWPIRGSICNVVLESQLERPQDDADDEGFGDEGADVLWLAVDRVDYSDESLYAPNSVWGW